MHLEQQEAMALLNRSALSVVKQRLPESVTRADLTLTSCCSGLVLTHTSSTCWY